METKKCATAYCREPIIVLRSKKEIALCEECNDKHLEELAQAWVRRNPEFVLKDGLIVKAGA